MMEGNKMELLRDESLQDLRTHLNQWWKDRTTSSAGGNLNDHMYLIGVVKDMVQDTGELFNITLGILDRLIEVNDLVTHLSEDTTELLKSAKTTNQREV